MAKLLIYGTLTLFLVGVASAADEAREGRKVKITTTQVGSKTRHREFDIDCPAGISLKELLESGTVQEILGTGSPVKFELTHSENAVEMPEVRPNKKSYVVPEVVIFLVHIPGVAN